MKKFIVLLALSAFSVCNVRAQTATELIGKWKLIKWTKKGKDKTVKDSTFQVFKDNGVFVSIVDGKEHKGKWTISKDNKVLTIRSGVFTVPCSIDYFDAKKRIITTDQVGTFEYEKVE